MASAYVIYFFHLSCKDLCYCGILTFVIVMSLLTWKSIASSKVLPGTVKEILSKIFWITIIPNRELCKLLR